MDPVILIILRYSLALLWLVAAVYKLTAFREFRFTMEDYRLLPVGSLTKGVAAAMPVLEAMIGIGLLVPSVVPLAATGSAILLFIYALAMAINLRRGRRHIDCGCSGPALRQSLSYSLVLRNLLLAGVSLACLVSTGVRSLLWLDYMTIIAAVFVLAVFYLAINHLAANAPDLARLRA